MRNSRRWEVRREMGKEKGEKAKDP